MGKFQVMIMILFEKKRYIEVRNMEIDKGRNE